jgi:RNA polymerase primary sigma factor
MRLASGSPVDADEAAELARESGLRVVDDAGDPWDELEHLAENGDEALKGTRGPSRVTEELNADSAATLYLREISRSALLTAEEEVMLAKQIEAGRAALAELGQAPADLDPERRIELEDAVETGEAARRRMIESNLRLVVSVAKKYIGRGLPFLDLVQEGNIGLQRGVEKFDWRRGFRFSTYAYWWIRQAIGRAVAEQSRSIRLPVHIIELLTKLYNGARELQAELGRPPTVDEIGHRLGVEPERVREAFAAAKVPISLEKPINSEAEATLADLIADRVSPSTADRAEESVLTSTLEEALDEYLTPRERRVVQLRFGLDRGGEERTLGEVGRELGLSRERVRQLEIESMAKLRRLPRFRQRFREYAS